MPSNLSKVQSSTGSEFDITTGSAVNTRVGTFVNMSLQKSFSTLATGVTYETNGTNAGVSRGTSASTGTPWLSQSYIDSVTIQGITYTFGEYVSDSGVPFSVWRNTTDSSTSNNQLYLRMNINQGTTLQATLRTIFENMSAGDTIDITAPFTQTLTISGTGITSSVSGSYKDFYFDVDESTGSSQYFYQANVTG